MRVMRSSLQGTESGIEIAYFRTEIDADSDGATAAQTAEFAFSPEDSGVISEARKYFESSPQPKDARVTGEVTDLKNSSAESEHRIKLAARINGQPKSVTIQLTPEQYASAMEAHGLGRLFTVVGELEMRKRMAHMDAPERVHIEEALVNEVTSQTRMSNSNAMPPPMFDI